jgi:hypothetical protein
MGLSVRSNFGVGLETEAYGAKLNMGCKDRNVHATKHPFDRPDSFVVPLWIWNCTDTDFADGQEQVQLCSPGLEELLLLSASR